MQPYVIDAILIINLILFTQIDLGINEEGKKLLCADILHHCPCSSTFQNTREDALIIPSLFHFQFKLFVNFLRLLSILNHIRVSYISGLFFGPKRDQKKAHKNSKISIVTIQDHFKISVKYIFNFSCSIEVRNSRKILF